MGELGRSAALLIAGQTGSGKSVMIGTCCSLLYRNSPSDMRLILVDRSKLKWHRMLIFAPSYAGD